VRFLINGNSFYYGRCLASYLPLHTTDGMSTSRIGVPNDMIQESQRPHVFLNPTESQGGDLILPFIWQSNALQIPQQEWTQMGKIIVRSFDILRHANGSTDPLNISVFAWAEDMHLSIPTSNQPGALSPQAGPDEYQGIISKPANVVANVASALTPIPQISRYAKATSTMAKAIGSLAGAHGYSKPVNVDVDKDVVNKVFPNSVNVEGLDSTTKLTLDPKQETTIDPRAMGMGSTDEMNIKSIACRESFLTSFAWELDSPVESRIFAVDVSPVLWSSNTDPLTSLVELHFPACCFATLPFRHWRGTMKFRFQIVCSAYHKGRLRFSYDPSSQISSEYNTNFNHVADISKEKDFTIEVGWGKDRSMLPHRTPGDEPPPHGRDWTPSVTYANNGVLTVYVVNPLTAANMDVDNNISINVFVSAGEDFEVFNPSAQWIDNLTFFNGVGTSNARMSRSEFIDEAMGREINISALDKAIELEKDEGTKEKLRFEAIESLKKSKLEFQETLSPQAGEMVHPDATDEPDEDAPMLGDATTELAPFRAPKGLNDVYYGDPVISFRQCLKRYNYHSSYGMTTTARAWHRFIVPNFPMYRGYAPEAINITAGGLPYNYMKNTLMNYLTPGFVLRRGSTRWRYHLNRGSTAPSLGAMMGVVRLPFSPVGFTYASTPMLNGDISLQQRAREAFIQMPATWAGAVVTDTLTNPVLSVDLPYYINTRFSHAKNANVASASNASYTNNQMHLLYTQSTTSAGAVVPARIDNYVAAGDDFSLSFFIGAPRMYRLGVGSDPPAQ